MYNLINTISDTILMENVDIDNRIASTINYAYALNGSDKRYVEVIEEPQELNIVPDYYPI